MDDPFSIDLVREAGGEIRLPPGARGPLQAYLEQALVNRDLLQVHLRKLVTRVDRSPQVARSLDAEQVEACLARGLSALDDATLAALSVAPPDLCRLHGEILERLPHAWLEVMRRDGLMLLREHGLSIPSPDQL